MLPACRSERNGALLSGGLGGASPRGGFVAAFSRGKVSEEGAPFRPGGPFDDLPAGWATGNAPTGGSSRGTRLHRGCRHREPLHLDLEVRRGAGGPERLVVR